MISGIAKAFLPADSPCDPNVWVEDWIGLLQDPMNTFDQASLAKLLAVGMERLHKDQEASRKS